jgi:hypothetical protein
MKKPSVRSIALGVAVLVATFGIVTSVFALSSAIDAGNNAVAMDTDDFSRERLTNAACIVQAAEDLGLGGDAQRIGVMTAAGESGLKVLDYGDEVGPDSRGLFQQRDNGAWGSLEDRMDPYESSRRFFEALTNVDGWKEMAPSTAAHLVQINADIDHYNQFLPFTDAVLDRLHNLGTPCPRD